MARGAIRCSGPQRVIDHEITARKTAIGASSSQMPGEVSKSAIGKNSWYPSRCELVTTRRDSPQTQSMPCPPDYWHILGREQTLFTLSKAKQTPASARNAHREKCKRTASGV